MTIARDYLAEAVAICAGSLIQPERDHLLALGEELLKQAIEAGTLRQELIRRDFRTIERGNNTVH